MPLTQIILTTEIKGVVFFIAQETSGQKLNPFTRSFTKWERKYFASYVRAGTTDTGILNLLPEKFTGYTTAWRKFKKMTRTARKEQITFKIK